jgi:hypothetical protein
MARLSFVRLPRSISAGGAIVAAAIMTLGLVSSMASAQGYGGQPGGGGGGTLGAPGRGGSNNPPVARNVLDPHMLVLINAMDPDNPIALILAARKDLKLTDSQTTMMYKIHDNMVTQQTPARLALDTLGPNPSIKSIDLAHLTTEGRDSLISHRKAVAAANGQIHDAARVAHERAMADLTPEQQKELTDLELRVRQARDQPHDTGTDEYTKPGSH